MATITWSIFAVDLAVRVLLCVRVVMRRAAVPTALAWLVLILFVPLLGLPAYLLVGEVRLGHWRRKRHARVARGLEERAAVFWQSGAQDWTSSFGPYTHIARLGAVVGGLPALRGNRLHLFGDCDHTLEALVRDIDGARARCHLVFYIWMPTGAGELVGEALLRAAARGVDCRVLVDSVGSRPFLRSPLCRRLRAGGVRVVEALPANPLRLVLARLDLRNHRKIAVIDGWIAYAGSQNVTDSTFGPRRPRGVGPWIDAMVRIEGPAAQALEVTFLRDWMMEVESEEIDPAAFLPDHPIPEGGSIVQVVPTGPGPGPNAMHEAILTTIYAAREELILTTPYFVPDEATRSALVAAAMRGVAVTIVVPSLIDTPITAAAGRAAYQDLLDAGVRMHEFQRGLLHAKTITVDRQLALIGSANLDMRSFWLNYEVTVFIYDSDVASHLRMLQVEYVSRSAELDADAWRRRPLWRRFLENVARLASPLL